MITSISLVVGLDLYKTMLNKKVLLHERKRHTARRVASTHSAVLSAGRGREKGGYSILT